MKTKPKSNVVKLVKPKKDYNKARQFLRVDAKEMEEDKEFPMEGYALVCWSQHGNRFRVRRYFRLDFPTLALPEMIKRALAENLSNSTENF